MSISVNKLSQIPYAYPVPDFISKTDLGGIKDEFKDIFKKYATIRDNLFSQLSGIFGLSGKRLDEKGHISLTDYIKDCCTDCDESNLAYKFYGNKIISQINRLSDYINEAMAVLSELDGISNDEGISEDDKNLSALCRTSFVKLECLIKFCEDIHKAFGTRYEYDFNEGNWKKVCDDYKEGERKQIGELDDKEPLLSWRNREDISTADKDASGKTVKKYLTCFNELNLLDRLKYIKLYYDIENGKKAGETDYVFPEDKATGVPCVAEEGNSSEKIANIEKFYLGYLIDRDGPVNAVASLIEVKIQALQDSITELSKKLKALNVYLDFINRGMDLLNQSQGNGNKRIPDGSIIALTYLCGQNMYNLFETKDGTKCLVLESAKEKGKYLLVEAGEVGKKWLIGDSAFSRTETIDGKKVPLAEGNGRCTLNYKYDEKGKRILDRRDTSIPMVYDYNYEYEFANGDSKFAEVGKVERYYFAYQDELGFHKINGKYVNAEKEIGNTFALPTQIEVTSVLPNSVQRYDADPTVYDKDKDKNSWKNVIESWQEAFRRKTGFIDDTVKSINTDIEVLRDKINTFDSFSTTQRNRSHDVYLNTINKISH